MDSNHRSPARKSRFLLRKANCGTERGQPKRVASYAVPMVRIHLPPAVSRTKSCSCREGPRSMAAETGNPRALQRYVETSIEKRNSDDPICMVPTDREAMPLIQLHSCWAAAFNVSKTRSGSYWGCRDGLAEFRRRNLFEDGAPLAARASPRTPVPRSKAADGHLQA
jgi:hypothetical protein